MSREVWRFPPSFAQQRLWFLAQLEPDSSFYNIPVAMRLKGPLQSGVLERSLNELVQRHESLRTSSDYGSWPNWNQIAPSTIFLWPCDSRVPCSQGCRNIVEGAIWF